MIFLAFLYCKVKWNYIHLFVVITALPFFIISLFFLEGEKKREREIIGDKKCSEFRFILLQKCNLEAIILLHKIKLDLLKTSFLHIRIFVDSPI